MQVNQPTAKDSTHPIYPISRQQIAHIVTILIWLAAAIMVVAVMAVTGVSGFDRNKIVGALVYDLLVLMPLVVIGILHTVRCCRTSASRKSIVLMWSVLTVIWFVTVWCVNYQSPDWDKFLLQWCQGYKDLSFADALKNITNISDYTPFYNYFLILFTRVFSLQGCLYAVKYLSFWFSILLATVMELIVCHVRQTKFSYLHLVLFLLLPPVLLEFTAWGQCDMIYTAFCLLAFYWALKHRSVLCFVSLGLAFAIKLQFLFIAPIIFLMLIIRDGDGKKYLSWKWCWLAPLMYVVNMLPLLVGTPFMDLIMVYFRQTDSYPDLSSNCLNFAMLFNFISDSGNLTATRIATLVLAVLGVAVTVWVLVMVLRAHRRQPLTPADLVRYALIFAFVMVYSMPKMHDRFYFVAMALACVWALVQPGWGNMLIAMSIMLTQTITVFTFLFHCIIPIEIAYSFLLFTAGVIINTVVLIALLKPLVRKAYCKFDETPMPR